MASEEFLTGMGILIGPLTFGKTLLDNLMSEFSIQSKIQTQSFTLSNNIFIKIIYTQCFLFVYFKILFVL